MDRRTALRGMFGAAVVVAAGGSLLASGEAQAAVPMPASAGSLMDDMRRAAEPAVATDADIAAARVENVQVACWRNRWGQLVCRRRPVRVVRVVRRRRCWYNRWGRLVCAY